MVAAPPANAPRRIDLPLRTPVGPGLHIAHSVGLVVNEQARIGANVTLFHG
jgi:serine O-acetyltransferase